MLPVWQALGALAHMAESSLWKYWALHRYWYHMADERTPGSEVSAETPGRPVLKQLTVHFNGTDHLQDIAFVFSWFVQFPSRFIEHMIGNSLHSRNVMLQQETVRRIIACVSVMYTHHDISVTACNIRNERQAHNEMREWSLVCEMVTQRERYHFLRVNKTPVGYVHFRTKEIRKS